jgi:uracil-DNA glycosylase
MTHLTILEKQNALDLLKKKFGNCTACPLGNLGRTQVVFGTGNANAQLMFIGEGPGRDEHLQGEPFIGRSGQLLTKMMSIAGIDRKNVFITNIVKCRPPENRKPTPIESTTCTNLLLFKQIEIIQPRIICTLGATALEGLVNRPVKITQERGTSFKWNNCTVIPTLHPAYILRNPTQVGTMVDDLVLAQQLAAR